MTIDIVRHIIRENRNIFLEGHKKMLDGESISRVFDETYIKLSKRPSNAFYLPEIGILTLGTAYAYFVRGF